MNSSRNEVEIRVVPKDQRAEALWLLFGWEPERLRRDRLVACIEASRADLTAFQFLFEAVQGKDRLGTVWGHVVPGRVANVWPPVCLPDSGQHVSDALQQTLDKHLATAGVVCGQSLLPIYAENAALCLLRNGYCHAARLLFLACDKAHLPSQPPSSELEFEPFQWNQRIRLEKLIEETYSGSLDAPLLNGIRTTADVVNGYRLAGDHVPERWFFVRQQHRDVGCLLLTEHRQSGQWEVIYMGVIPSTRRRGWGEVITRYAQWLTRQAGRDVILLGVDEANHPAITAYSRCGFYELDRRLVLIKQLGDSS